MQFVMAWWISARAFKNEGFVPMHFPYDLCNGYYPRDKLLIIQQTVRAVNNYFKARLRMLSVAVRDND